MSSIIKNKKSTDGTIEGLEGGNFYAYIARMKYITRWGLMRNTEKENIQEHSLEVAILAHALCLIRNEMYADEPAKKLDPEKACLFAVFHDSDEIITGDLPTPIKYANPVIRDNYHDIEAQSKEKLLSMLPEKLKPVYKNILFFDESSPEYKTVVKAADRLSAYIKCVEECKAGNAEFTKARQTVLDSMRAMDLPELDYFIEQFRPAYSLTLDELEKRQ